MRIARLSDLQRNDRGKGDEPGMSPWAQAQIEAAFSEIVSDETVCEKGRSRRSPRADASTLGSRTRSTRGESAGEAAVGLALRAAFGDWHRDGGEVVKELMPFSTRRFRADYALPDYRVAVEILGWHAHGQHLKEHHKDRERNNFFARHDWLMFSVSHGQALGDLGPLVDDLAHVMTLRRRIGRDRIVLDPIAHKHGVWYRMRVAEQS